MLNRRILRIKAFKELFASQMISSQTLANAQKELDVAIESTRDLYLFMLNSIPALTEVAKAKMEQLSMKVNKTEEEKNPNTKFVDNALAPLLEQDPDFSKILKKKNLGWEPYGLILEKVFASIQTKDYFKEYMSVPSRSLKEDCKLFIRIFEEEYVDREDLDIALEDRSIYWNDDLAYSLTCCCKSVAELGKGSRWSLPELYISDARKDMADDRAFVHKLMQEAYMHYNEYFTAISATVPNWDKERLVGTDIAIIITALAEIVNFPDIPLNVSINEYVEISKYYGTTKSSTFVNGILDTLSKQVEFKKIKTC